MRDLSAHRQGWEVAESFRWNDLAALTPQETLHQFRQLCAEFAPLLEETEAVFRPKREHYLIRLQEQLLRLAAWQNNRQ